MYCGGSHEISCPCCHGPWGQHATNCKYYDRATALLNSRATALLNSRKVRHGKVRRGKVAR